MLISLLARTELVQEWRRQLPANAPNYFALNLFESELPAFQRFLQEHGIASSDLFPIVRGRLTAINGVDAHRFIRPDSPGEDALNRELSLTWSANMPADNRLTEGAWWDENTTPESVSIEAKLAESLQIKLGDTLTFTVGGQERKAVVSSLRSLRWDTLRPNFYMIFPPGGLQGFPSTWLTSFYVPTERKADLVALAKSFPAMTVLEVEQLVKQFQTILKEITVAIEFVLLFALAAGFAVLFAAVRATLDERLREDALLRAMGASHSLLGKSLGLEFTVLGLLAGLLAAIASEAIAWAVFNRAFDLVPRFHWEIWGLAPLVGAIAVGASGYWHTRRVVRASPMKILREL
jgi:putative ABC transport system permease protein